MRAAFGTSSQQRDAALVLRYRDGDRSAFAELYEIHHPRLLRCVRRQVRQGHIAEDLAHDAFAAALAGIADLRDPARFYPWLVGIARVLVVRHYRAAGRTSGLADTVPVESEAPEHALLRRVDHDNVTLAMGRLRERYREVLRLHEHEELSYSDIAERLSVSPSIVKLLMHRARRALRREYLAVTEPERTAAVVPLLFGAVAALRRLRDRALQIAAHVPDGATAAGSVVAVSAGVVLGLGGLLGHEEAPPKDSTTVVSVANVAVPKVTSRADDGDGVTHAGVSGPDSAPARPNTPATLRTDVGEAGVRGEDARRTRDRVREWPIVFDRGPVGFGINPQPLWEDLAAISEDRRAH